MADSGVYIAPNIDNINGPAAFGPNATGVKIENLYQQGKFADLFLAGEKLLAEGQYEWARQAFSKYLGGTESDESFTDPVKRSQAYVYYAVAILARTRPDHRRTDEITDVARCLVSGRSHPLAPILAALLRDDTDTGGIRRMADLRGLAESVVVDRLTASDVLFLSTHVVACAGPTWRQLRQRAAVHGVLLADFETVSELPASDPVRLHLVPKYFTADPRAPKPVQTTAALVMLVAGVVSLVASCASVTVGANAAQGASASSDAAGGMCMGFLLLAAAVGLFIGSGVSFGRYRAYRALRRKYEADWRAAQPKPSDEQMDGWLTEDIGRIEALGATRHHLSRNVVADGGSLLVEPQTIVGLSSRTVLARRFVTVPDQASPGGFRSMFVDVQVPLARFRYGADGQLRADNYRILSIYLTVDRVCVFDVELELATRRLVQERKLAFRYRDIVAIESSTVPASAAGSERVRELLNIFIGSDYIRDIQAIEDERFALSIVDGDKVEMNIGFGLSFRGYTREGHTIAWGNQQVLRTVERQVWERRDGEGR